MKKENKKPILSKRVVICLVIASFLIISSIFIAIISTEGDSSPSDTPLNESNSSETSFPLLNIFGDSSEKVSEGEEDGDETIVGDIPFWVFVIAGIIGSYLISKRLWRIF